MTGPIASAAARAPHAAGVYFFLDADRTLLYVGKAADLRRRLGDHARDSSRTADLRKHVLLHAVATVHWEEHADEAAASAREADLIVMLRPQFNASHADQDPAVYLVVTAGPEVTAFALTAHPAEAGRVYGTFPHLAKGAHSSVAKRTKGGYTALLRLLWSAAPQPSASVPTRLAGASPPVRFDTAVSAESRAALHDFLSGRSARLTTSLRHAIASADIPEFTRFALERDAGAAREFFEAGPRHVRQVRLRHALPTGPVRADVMADLFAQELTGTIGAFRRGAAADDVGMGRRAARERQLRELLRH